ncbi:MAG TPA: type II secretion system protein GspG [Gemmataceae bacterium]|nr:type II secretion system protein GspG [Gemmataceae bacterium]
MNLVMALVLGFFSAKQDEAKEKMAELNARGLAQACEAFYLNPNSNSIFPARLAELVNPPFGGASFVRNGAKDLLDPWGKEYKYALETLRDGAQVPRVWTERVVNGKAKVYGHKPADKKQ